MIVDSSAIVAMLFEESGYESLREKLLFADRRPRMASASFLETAIVIDRKGDITSSRKLDDLLVEARIELVAFMPEHAKLARDAYREYGKGSGHPAKLNFGDCVAYAMARAERQPLLFVGDDFAHTDIEAA